MQPSHSGSAVQGVMHQLGQKNERVIETHEVGHFLLDILLFLIAGFPKKCATLTCHFCCCCYVVGMWCILRIKATHVVQTLQCSLGCVFLRTPMHV